MPTETADTKVAGALSSPEEAERMMKALEKARELAARPLSESERDKLNKWWEVVEGTPV